MNEKDVQQAKLHMGAIIPVAGNLPGQYADKQHEYFQTATSLFRHQYLQYASDFVEADMQFWPNGGNEAEWRTVKLRFAEVVRPTAAIQRDFDDYKQIIPQDPRIQYIRQGTKIRAMGSVWLVTNPANISGGEGMAIVRRCNAVWNHLDYYGNIVSEPIIKENVRANASSPDVQIDQQIVNGYYNITCQYNEFTRQANDNTRIVLGDQGNPFENAKAYRITGFGNFTREFTEDASSVRLLSFTIRVQTKNSDTDDLVNCVADGKNFRWDMRMTGPNIVGTGETAQFSAASMRNGETVESTEENPISYVWTVSDPEIASIDQNGVLTAIRAGNVRVTAVLAQNTQKSASMELTVNGSGSGIRFFGSIPPYLGPLDSFTMQAVVYENGTEVRTEVHFTLSGADENAYSYSVYGYNRLTVTCFGYSETPLTITATAWDYAESVTVGLEGI